jgi:hypothetical protein
LQLLAILDTNTCEVSAIFRAASAGLPSLLPGLASNEEMWQLLAILDTNTFEVSAIF